GEGNQVRKFLGAVAPDRQLKEGRQSTYLEFREDLQLLVQRGWSGRRTRRDTSFAPSQRLGGRRARSRDLDAAECLFDFVFARGALSGAASLLRQSGRPNCRASGAAEGGRR